MQKVVIPLDTLYKENELELCNLTDKQLELVIFLMNSAYYIGCTSK
jgi:hypothetical protein